jgi:hypothetical protein
LFFDAFVDSVHINSTSSRFLSMLWENS